MIRAEGVEATEFPELANQFNVRGVPQTVINAGDGNSRRRSAREKPDRRDHARHVTKHS